MSLSKISRQLARSAAYADLDERLGTHRDDDRLHPPPTQPIIAHATGNKCLVHWYSRNMKDTWVRDKGHSFQTPRQHPSHLPLIAMYHKNKPAKRAANPFQPKGAWICTYDFKCAGSENLLPLASIGASHPCCCNCHDKEWKFCALLLGTLQPRLYAPSLKLLSCICSSTSSFESETSALVMACRWLPQP